MSPESLWLTGVRLLDTSFTGLSKFTRSLKVSLRAWVSLEDPSWAHVQPLLGFSSAHGSWLTAHMPSKD